MRKAEFTNYISFIISLAATFISVGILLKYLFVPFSHYLELLSAMVAVITGISMAYAFSRLIRRKAALFVSFSYLDKDIAMKIVNDLIKDGYRIYVSSEIITVGDNIKDTIEKAIKNAHFFIYFISQNSLESSWVSREYEYAKSNNLKIFPVVLSPVQIPPELRNICYVDFSQDYDQAYKLLEKSIRKNVGHLEGASPNKEATGSMGSGLEL